MKRYKWEHPKDWLDQKIANTKDIEELQKLCFDLANYLDGDSIQSAFQNEMEADGYFKPIREKK